MDSSSSTPLDEAEALVADIYKRKDELKLRKMHHVACPLSKSRRNRLLALMQPFLPWNQFRHWGLLIDEKCYELRWIAEKTVGLEINVWESRGTIFVHSGFVGWTQKTDEEISDAAIQCAKPFTTEGYSLDHDLNCHGYAADLYDAIVYRPELFAGRDVFPMKISRFLGHMANAWVTFAVSFIGINALSMLVYQNLWRALAYALLTAVTGIYINSIMPGGQDMTTEAKILRNILFSWFSSFYADTRNVERILRQKRRAGHPEKRRTFDLLRQ